MGRLPLRKGSRRLSVRRSSPASGAGGSRAPPSRRIARGEHPGRLGEQLVHELPVPLDLRGDRRPAFSSRSSMSRASRWSSQTVRNAGSRQYRHRMRSRLPGSLSASASTASKLHPTRHAGRSPRGEAGANGAAAGVRNGYRTGTVPAHAGPATAEGSRGPGRGRNGRRRVPRPRPCRAEARQGYRTVLYGYRTCPCRPMPGVSRGPVEGKGGGRGCAPASLPTRVAAGRTTRISRAFDGSPRPELCYVQDTAWGERGHHGGAGRRWRATLRRCRTAPVLPPTAVLEALARALASGSFGAGAGSKAS